MPGKMDSFKALSAQDKRHAVVNWLLDHAMIIIILLLAVYVQIQRPQFFGVPSLVNIVSLTAARLPMALGVAGCIVLAGTDLTGGRVAGLTAFVAAILLQKAGANGRFIADGVPQNLLLVVLLVMVIGACIGFVNGFVMAKWKLHPYIITLAMQMITYGIYLTVSNSKQVSSLDPSYTTSFVTKSFVKFGTTSVPMYVVLAIFVGHHVGGMEQDDLRQEYVCRRLQRGSGARFRRERHGDDHRRVHAGWRALRLHRLCRGRAPRLLHRDPRPELRG